MSVDSVDGSMVSSVAGILKKKALQNGTTTTTIERPQEVENAFQFAVKEGFVSDGRALAQTGSNNGRRAGLEAGDRVMVVDNQGVCGLAVVEAAAIHLPPWLSDREKWTWITEAKLKNGIAKKKGNILASGFKLAEEDGNSTLYCIVALDNNNGWVVAEEAAVKAQVSRGMRVDLKPQTSDLFKTWHAHAEGTTGGNTSAFPGVDNTVSVHTFPTTGVISGWTIACNRHPSYETQFVWWVQLHGETTPAELVGKNVFVHGCEIAASRSVSAVSKEATAGAKRKRSENVVVNGETAPAAAAAVAVNVEEAANGVATGDNRGRPATPDADKNTSMVAERNMSVAHDQAADAPSPQNKDPRVSDEMVKHEQDAQQAPKKAAAEVENASARQSKNATPAAAPAPSEQQQQQQQQPVAPPTSTTAATTQVKKRKKKLYSSKGFGSEQFVKEVEMMERHCTAEDSDASTTTLDTEMLAEKLRAFIAAHQGSTAVAAQIKALRMAEPIARNPDYGKNI